MDEYDFGQIEKKWQQRWDQDKIFEVKEDPKKEKYYILEMYPYPSGKLHMGHLRNYTIGDAFARFMRMSGFNVLYPMGYDSFGLPAENAAIDEGASPEEWTNFNMDTMRAQQKRIGLSYDWNREIYSHDPNYYKWDQWFFLKMYEKGLAYRQESYVNWCPKCATVLANEQVQGGKCWRCNSEVEQRFLTQWFLKILAYAEELLNGLNDVEWPDRVKTMQRNWIGRSEGSIIKFPIVGENRTIDIFTTRADTIYGVTFMVFAPEHPWVKEWVKDTEYEKDFEVLYSEIMKENTFERTDVEIEKKGMFIGKYAVNPITKEKIPVYISNFVVYSYGAGAVMAVPAHDQRDFEFSKKYNIDIKVVIQPPDFELNAEKMTRSYEGDGTLVNSHEFDGINNRDAIKAITKRLEQMKSGNETINYKLRDWLISRQRYWGCPIPIIYCDSCGIIPVSYKDLPVLLPKDVKFTGKGNPLETSENFINMKCPRCKGKARRETDTMDTFVDSSWYFFKFCDPRTKDHPYRKKNVDYWGNVDQYIGGIEHAVLHLLYARFWTKVSRDIELHSHNEPFQRLLTQGMINKVHPYCPKCDTFAMKAEMHEKKCKRCNTNYELRSVKMSKSYGNTVDPNEIMDNYGADAARFFILFGASPESSLEWSDEGVSFASKFVLRTFQLLKDPAEKHRKKKTIVDTLMIYQLNKTIKNVKEAFDMIAIRDAVNSLIQFVAELIKYKNEGVIDEVYESCREKLTLILHPIVPHMTEEIWETMGKTDYISLAPWPSYDESLLTDLNEFKWNLMNNILEDINSIKLITKINKITIVSIIIADNWKYNFYSLLMKLIENTKNEDKALNQGEILKEIMKNKDFKQYGKFISQTTDKIVKNIGKFAKLTQTSGEEFQFFNEIKPIIEKKFECKVNISHEKDITQEKKANQALPGKPALIIS